MFIFFIKYMHNLIFLFVFFFTDDHSRVILESTENGDYINANFIKVCNTNTLSLTYKT